MIIPVNDLSRLQFTEFQMSLYSIVVVTSIESTFLNVSVSILFNLMQINVAPVTS